MFQLVYNSEANLDLTSEDISDILNTSRDFNSRNSITGCLLYYNDEFLQILEGEKEVVQNLFSSIRRDRRHSNVMLLVEDDKNERMFSDWSMAYQEFENHDSEKNFFLKNIAAFSMISDKPNYVIDLFWIMAKHIANN